MTAARRKTHPAEWRSWSSMRNRCRSQSSDNWPQYGGRGITICERWDSFAAFFEDMGPRPSQKHTLDRYPNPDGNYEPGNCRWATQREQTNNRSRGNRKLSFGGETLTVAEWARRIGVDRATLRDRLERGWTVEQALTTPKEVSRMRGSYGRFSSEIAIAAGRVAPYRPRQRAETCRRGHAYDDANTYIHKGKRHCRKCNAIRAACAKRRNNRHPAHRPEPGL